MYEFTANQLVVRVDKGNKPPTEIVARNGNDKDNNLEFSVEMHGQGDPLGTQKSTTLGFLSDPIDLTLKPKPKAGGGGVSKADKKCDSETGKYERIPKDDNTNLEQANTTVFINYTGSEDLLKDLRFDADLTEKAIGEEAEDPRNPDIAVCPQDPAEDMLRPTEAPGVGSLGISLEVESPDTKTWAKKWWYPSNSWKYISTPDIPESWSRLSGQLVVYADNQTAGEDIDPAVLSVQLFSPASGYWSWLSRITLVAVIFALSMMPLLVEGVWLYRESDNMRSFAFKYMLTAIIVVVGYLIIEVTTGTLRWIVLLLWLLVSVLITALLLRSRAENSADGATPNFVNRLLQPLDFDFKKDWVSTVTTAGAILGTVVSAGLLPEDTYLMPKEQYTALNVVFGLTVLVLPSIGIEVE